MNFSAFGLLIGMLFTAPMVSCNKNEKDEVAAPQLDLKRISYGNDTAQIMDVYLPAARNIDSTKVIVFIHGGSWSGGDKSDFNDAIDPIRSKLPDYAIFNINYRLAYNGRNRFPAQMEDIQAALEFIESKASDYKINTNKVALVGASAGAHLALLYAYKNNSDGKIKAVVDLFGPTDLTDLYNNHPIPQASQPVLINLLGGTPATKPTLYQQASPISFVNKQTVPTLIFQGGSDIIVPINQSVKLKNKLEANNIEADLVIYKQEGHGWYGSSLFDTYKKTIEFIKANVQ